MGSVFYFLYTRNGLDVDLNFVGVRLLKSGSNLRTKLMIAMVFGRKWGF